MTNELITKAARDSTEGASSSSMSSDQPFPQSHFTQRICMKDAMRRYTVLLIPQGIMMLSALNAMSELSTNTFVFSIFWLLALSTLLRLLEPRWYPLVREHMQFQHVFRLGKATTTLTLAAIIYSIAIFLYNTEEKIEKILSFDTLVSVALASSTLFLIGFVSFVLIPWIFLKFEPNTQRFFFFTSKTSCQTSNNVSWEYYELQRSVQQLKIIVDHLSEHRALAYSELRTRGQRLRSLNVWLLILMVAVLISAAGFIVFAGQIAGKDTQSLDSMRNLSTSITTTSENIEKLETERGDQSLSKIKVERELEDTTISGAKKQDLLDKGDRAKLKFETLSKQITRLETELERQRKMASDLESSLYSVNTGAKDPVTATNLLVAAGITRFGVLAVVIYLVQILVGLYRYNAQLAGHYLAHADAVLLSGSSIKEMGVLSNQLQPHVSFGKPVETMPEKMIEKMGNIFKATIEKTTQGKV